MFALCVSIHVLCFSFCLNYAVLDTVVQALPQVGNLGLLFFLLFFIFAALGVELFGKLACDEKHPCEGLGEHASKFVVGA